ncbi:MAG: dephospho-CoA kinase [Pirellulales bacterium]
MKTIGLVGGVASGKSLVAQMFVELGAGLLDADRAGHEVLSGDPAVREPLLAYFGPDVLATDGTFDRAAIANRVFGEGETAAANLKFLESVLHPRIGRLLAERQAAFAAAGQIAVILDAPLLLEANWNGLCDVVVFVDADPAVRLARALARGWTADEFARREAAQWPVERKRVAADVVIANNGDVDSLRKSVCDVWHKYVAS